MSSIIGGTSGSGVVSNINTIDPSKEGVAREQGDGAISAGVATLYKSMNMFSEQANNNYRLLREKANLSRQAESASNEVDEVLAGVENKGNTATGTVPADVVTFMKQHAITVDGMNIDDFLKKYKNKLPKAQLQAVKNALQTSSNEASDFVSQNQLRLQKILQTYNVTVSLINSMQTLLAEMNKTIAQNIR
ncbi:MAG: secretion protein EspA [Parashewanella sp.]